MKSILTFLNQEIPLFTSWKTKVLLIGFLALFTLAFLLIYAPFNMNQWDEASYLTYITIGAGVLLFSHFILLPILGYKKVKLYGFVLLCLLEVLLISILIDFFLSPTFPTFQEEVEEYLSTLRYVALIIIVPYMILAFYLWFSPRSSILFTREQSNETAPQKNKSNSLLTISGENDKIILAINYRQLLYIKSAGNYVELHYLKGEKPTMELIRMSLKELEGKITDSNIVRTHRSYIINIQHISSYKKTRKGYTILVHYYPEEHLPVSSGYKDFFESALKQNVSH